MRSPRRDGLAMISDEVFAPYRFATARARRAALPGGGAGAGGARADLQPGRPVEGVRPAAAQARLDRRRGPPWRWPRCAGAAGADRRHLSLGRPARCSARCLGCWSSAPRPRRASRSRVARQPRQPAGARSARVALHLLNAEGGWTAILRVPDLAGDGASDEGGRCGCWTRTASWCTPATSSTCRRAPTWWSACCRRRKHSIHGIAAIIARCRDSVP